MIVKVKFQIVIMLSVIYTEMVNSKTIVQSTVNSSAVSNSNSDLELKIEKAIDNIKRGIFLDGDLTPEDIIILFVIKKYKHCLNWFLEESIKFCEMILSDETIRLSDNIMLKNLENNLRDYLEKAYNCKHVKQQYELLDIFYNYTDYYCKDCDNTIGIILQKYGLNEFWLEFKYHANQFANEFYKEFDHVKKKLTNEQIQYIEHLFQHIKDLKTLTD